MVRTAVNSDVNIDGLPSEYLMPAAGSAVLKSTDVHSATGGNSLWRPAQAVFERRMKSKVVVMPDGEPVRFWTFEDPTGRAESSFMSSPLIRIGERQQAAITLKTQMPVRRASRHQAAIGRCSDPVWMEAQESFTYHWEPQKAGTWFYQCHTSNARLFEMGLFGVLAVDFEPETGAARRAYADGPQFDVERFWVFDDVDPEWHREEFDGQAMDRPGRLRSFKPKYFLINGVPNTEARDHQDVAVEAKLGDKVLLRLMNASFSLVRVTIERLASNIISVDGNVLGSRERPWSQWISMASGQPLHLATGSRHDVVIDLDPARGGCPGPGEYAVTFEFEDGRRREVHNLRAAHPAHIGRATTIIRVL